MNKIIIIASMLLGSIYGADINNGDYLGLTVDKGVSLSTLLKVNNGFATLTSVNSTGSIMSMKTKINKEDDKTYLTVDAPIKVKLMIELQDDGSVKLFNKNGDSVGILKKIEG
jgi:hypothetical protein